MMAVISVPPTPGMRGKHQIRAALVDGFQRFGARGRGLEAGAAEEFIQPARDDRAARGIGRRRSTDAAWMFDNAQKQFAAVATMALNLPRRARNESGN